MKLPAIYVLLVLLFTTLMVGCVTINKAGNTSSAAPLPRTEVLPPTTNQPPVTPPSSSLLQSTPKSQNWSGTWDTNWGKMQLIQSAGSVTGTYTHDSGKISGSISKNVTGNILIGTWSETPSYAPTKDAGDFEFTMAPDFNSFTGKWRYGSSGAWSGDWKATRVSQ
jgi:hypothetical protein